MFCVLMHLLHGNHGEHSRQVEPTPGHPTPTDVELAELRGEVRALRAVVASLSTSTTPPTPTGTGAHDGHQ